MCVYIFVFVLCEGNYHIYIPTIVHYYFINTQLWQITSNYWGLTFLSMIICVQICKLCAGPLGFDLQNYINGLPSLYYKPDSWTQVLFLCLYYMSFFFFKSSVLPKSQFFLCFYLYYDKKIKNLSSWVGQISAIENLCGPAATKIYWAETFFSGPICYHSLYPIFKLLGLLRFL